MRKIRRSGFGWQALLILLPVAILAAVGIHALRQDRRLVYQDAVQRAQVLADEILPKLWAALEETNVIAQAEQRRLEFDDSGELTFPPAPLGPPGPKPLDHSQLSGREIELLAQLDRTLEAEPNQPTGETLAALLATEPPPRIISLAKLRAAQTLSRAGKKDEALKLFNDLSQNAANELTEAGVPIGILSEFNACLLEPINSGADARRERLTSLCSNLVRSPTFLTPYLLEKASTLGDGDTLLTWQTNYAAHRLNYERFKAAGKRFGHAIANVPFVWSVAEDSQDTTNSEAPRLLAVRKGEYFYSSSEAEITDRLHRVMDQVKNVPAYFGVGVELDGREPLGLRALLHQWKEVHYVGRKGGGFRHEYNEHEATNVLASVIQPGTMQAPFKVLIYLTNPAALYQQQIAREFWFRAVIASSAIASLIGLFATWRAFHRQERLAELKTNFVSSVSHELRSPIASVRLMAESLETGKIDTPQKQHDYFRFVGRECRRLSSLIENILDFSRIEQGRKQYEFEPTDIVSLVQQTVATMKRYAAERGVSIELEAQPNASRIEANVDGRALQQALVNLLDNAIKHSAQGQVVRCSAVVQAAIEAMDESALQIVVTDCGSGIPESEHEKIFERFYRLGSELRRETQGVGIGLSIVKHIVDAHGGTITVESKPGNGSRFIMELPLNPIKAR